MCFNCYQEYGEPKIINGRVIRAAEMMQDVDPFGRFHIVVDDYNLEDEHVDGCISEPPRELEHPIEREFGELFRSLSVDERASALAIFDEYIDRNGVDLYRQRYGDPG